MNKVVILAGGLGSRLSEETNLIPKPMVKIGGMPILWHIMKIYSSFGFSEFLILLGYKSYVVKEYFANYFLHKSDVTIDLKNNSIDYLDNKCESWKISLIDTGLNTMTGGRIKKIAKFIPKNETFMLTYGDGVANLDINNLIKFHKSHGKTVTMSAYQPEGRFGSIEIGEKNIIKSFQEKPKGDNNWINAGFFVCNSNVFDFIGNSDDVIFEKEPLELLCEKNELCCFKHTGFWKPMDTLRDKNNLEELWRIGKAPWKVWND